MPLKKHIFLLVTACFFIIETPTIYAQEKKLSRREKAKIERERKTEEKRLAKEEKRRKKLEPPPNIEYLPKNFLFKVRYVIPNVVLDISTRDAKSTSFDYRPFIPGVVGAGIKIKKIYISYAQKIPSTPRQNTRFGKTDFRDFNFQFQWRITGIQLFYQDYKGFYLLRPEKYDTAYADRTYFPRSRSLRTYSVGMNMNWVFTKSFSLNAAFAQSERQKESAGSFMLGFTERFDRLQMDSSIVPASLTSTYPTLHRYSFGSNFSSILYAGLGYSFVKSNFSITPVLMVGSGLQIQNYNAPQNRWDLRIPLYGNFRLAAGYNGDNFFTNVMFHAQVMTMSAKETRITLAYTFGEFAIGFRF